MRIWIVAIIFLTNLISGCSNKGLYSKNNMYLNYLESIMVISNGKYKDIELYNHLKNLIPNSANKIYKLEFKTKLIENYSLIQKSSDILRELVTIKVSYKLRSIDNDSLITSGSFTRLSSYNTTFSPYNNEIKRQDVIKNLLIASAEEIKNRLIVYLSKKHEADNKRL